MHKLYLVLFLILNVCLLPKANAQSIINPSDPIVDFTASSNPTVPANNNTIYKWGRDSSLNWNTVEWKCYVINGMPFRVHFPLSYKYGVADGKLYPLMVFLHGAGEAGPVTNNETQLYHGGNVFQAETDGGNFDAFVVCPESTGGWGTTQWQSITYIIDYMIANNKVDMARVVFNGLSDGGYGVWGMDNMFPNYIAGALPMSACSLNYTTNSYVDSAMFTPYWLFQGGEDTGPAPYTTNQVLPYYYNVGANLTFTLFPTQGHDTWDSAWLEPNFFPFVLACNEANPWPLFGRTKFCPGDSINVTMGVAPGCQAYQWALNSTSNVISGATTNTLNVKAPGVYYCRYERNNIWSNWSPTPCSIVVQGATQTPNITLAAPQTDAIPGPDGTNTVTMTLPSGDSVYSWYKLGSSTVLSTTNTLTVSTPGDYYATDIPQYGCSSIPSPTFEVINAQGANAPVAAASLVVHSLGYTKMALTWASQPNPTNAPTAFEVYRATHSGGPYTYLGQTIPSVTAWTDSAGLNAGTTYYYVIRAIDTSGAAPVSPQGYASTNKDTIPPTAPTNLSVMGSTNSSIEVDWNSATDNVAVDHYNIYVNGVLSYKTTDTVFFVGGLTQGQWCVITVAAVDPSGNVGPYSNQVSGAAISQGLRYNYYTSTTTPSSVSNIPSMKLMATGISPNTNINLYTGSTTTNFAYVWTGYINIPINGTYTFATASDDGSELFFNSLTPTGTPTVNNDGPHGVTTAQSASMNLTAGVYPICIEYFQAGGGYSMSAEWSCPQLNGNSTLIAIPNQYFTEVSYPPGTIPAKPTKIKAQALSYNKVQVSWTNNATNQSGFEVYRASSESGPFTILGSPSASTTSFIDSTAAPSTQYYYRVQAINSTGESGFDTASCGGLGWNYYEGNYGSPIPYLPTYVPVTSGTLNNFSLNIANNYVNTYFAMLFWGYLKAPVTGTYTFATGSDDASNLYIGGYAPAYKVVSNDYQQSLTVRSGTINLTAGQYYPIYVAYDQGTGSFILHVYWTLPGTTTQVAIPDSAFYNPNWTATTSALPAAPVVPTLTGVSPIPSKIQLSWTDTSHYISSYTLNRSIGDSLHFLYLTNPLASATGYLDSGLFGHQTYYYQLQATGAGGTSAFTHALGVTTLDHYPTVVSTPNQTIRYGVTTVINFNATDSDGDAMTFTGVNLPTGWATLVDNHNGTATLTLTPASGNAGTYNGIGVSVNDGYGGTTVSTFNLTVNNNYSPVITTVSPVTINTGSTLNIPLTATSPSGDNMTFAVSGVPNNYTLAVGPNGSDTLKLTPTFGATGSYTVTVTVTDNMGGITSSTFPVTVVFSNPTRVAELRINAGDSVGHPWNNIDGPTLATILDTTGTATPWSFNLNTTYWATLQSGPETGNNSGVYPDLVEHDLYYFGKTDVWGMPDSIQPSITGLDKTKLYNVTFYGGSVYNYVSTNGTTVYGCNGQSAALYVQGNTANTVTLSNLSPDSTGTLTFHISKANDGVTPIGILNAIVLTQEFNDGTKPLSPYGLAANLVSATSSQVVLTWSDSAYNEAGYEIWRATNAAGPWTQILPDAPAKAITYTDSSTLGFTTYYYKVRAVNGNGDSYFTNVATISTPDRVPSLVPVSNISLNWGTNDTVQVFTTGGTGNTITLKASGLPSFASFTDNGNGTGTLIVNAPDSTTGTYSTPVITMTDIADSVRTTTFTIMVKNPQISTVYVHFSDGVNNGPQPWNNITVWPAAGNGQGNLLNDANTNSGLALTFQTQFEGVSAVGEETGNNSGIFPDPVLRSTLFENGSQTDSLQISGLTPGTNYNFKIYSGTDWGVSGPTSFNLNGGQSQSINPAYNLTNLIQYKNITPRANGTVSIGMTKSAAAQSAYWNDLIIEGFNPANLTIEGPSNLHTTGVTRNKVMLAWQDNSWNETGFEVWRTTDSTDTYKRIAVLAANTTAYTDSNLTSNMTYYYIVRAVNGSTPSTYSNPVAATTSDYAVYMEFNQPNLNLAGLPWNPMNEQPATGTTWNNLFDDQGNIVSWTMVLSGLWAGTTNQGMQTGNNTGAVPDIVAVDSYVLFAGQQGGFKISGLDLKKTYNVTFFNSINFQAPAATSFLVNGKNVILNASQNIYGTVTASGVKPDVNGNISITVSPLTPSTEYGILNAMIIRAYTGDSNAIPQAPVTGTGMGSDVAAEQTLATNNGDTTISAFPNPFATTVTVKVPVAEKRG